MRFAAEDVTMVGQTIRRGDSVSVVLGSANRDEAEFEQPDTFNIQRTPNRHLAFGTGPHICLGILLARRVDGEIQVRPYDMELLFAPDDPTVRTEYPYVQPGDVVYVLRTWQDEYDSVMASLVQTLRGVQFFERVITGADQAVTVL